MSEPKYLRHWPQFLEVMEQRLHTGFLEYGDGSFERPMRDLAGEIEEEMLDIIGWAFIGWCRLQALKPKTDLFDEEPEK